MYNLQKIQLGCSDAAFVLDVVVDVDANVDDDAIALGLAVGIPFRAVCEYVGGLLLCGALPVSCAAL